MPVPTIAIPAVTVSVRAVAVSAWRQAVRALLARPAIPHQPDLAEYPQMFGRRGLGHPQILGMDGGP